jgi:LPXTG-motif cell wall-anchored protein
MAGVVTTLCGNTAFHPDPIFWGYHLRRFMPSTRRMTTLAGAAFVGIAATAMFAAPASAHAAIVSGTSDCAVDGTYTIHWKIENKRFDRNEGWALTLKDVSPAGLKGSDGKPLDDNFTIPANGARTFDQTKVPGTDKSATLSFKANWSDEWRDDSTYSGSVTLKGDCKPPANGGGGGGTTPTPTPTPTKTTAAPTLPVTGSQTGLYAGGAVVLLGAGAGLFMVARRRRVNFEA